MVDGFALRTSSFELSTTSQPIRLKIPRGAIENRNTPGTRHSAFCMSTTLIKTLILPPHIFSLKMLMSLVRAFTAVVYRSPGSRCVPHLVPCTVAMAHRRLATLCSHMSAGTDSTRRLPDTPKMSTFKCANGLDIFTKVWGQPSSDRKVLALHGFLDNTGSFELLGPALAKEGFEVVAMDFPGHGKSSHMSKDAWYPLLDLPEYVIEAARSMGWDRCSLVGHSMGGAVASLLAASHPELVERCVFIDILGPHSTNPGSNPKQLRANIASKRALLTKEPKPYASFDQAVRARLKSVSLRGEGLTLSLAGATHLVAGGTEGRGEDGEVKFTSDMRLRGSSPGYLTEETVLTYLRAIECACLVVRGETGMMSDTPKHLARKAAFSGPFQELVLPGSHHLHLDDESAPLVASHVAAFLHDREP